MRKVKKVLAFHFDEGRSARTIATHCGMSRRAVGQTVERFEATGMDWPEAAKLDDAALEALLYPTRQPARKDDDVDWAEVERSLSRRGMTLKLLWEEWAKTHPGGMS